MPKLADPVGEGIYENSKRYTIYYRYDDERYKEFYKSARESSVVDMRWDVALEVLKMTSPENPKKRIQEIEAENKIKDRKMKQCEPEYEAVNETTDAMPSRIVKRLKHQNGGDILIVQ